MILYVLTGIFGGILLLYCIQIASYTNVLKNIQSDAKKPCPESFTISVIIPFRNEEAVLPLIIQDIRNFNYPPHLIEVIFIDDHSEDNSAMLVQGLANDLPWCRLLELPEELTGKKAAIKFGVQLSSAEWIIQTDADCRLDPDWPVEHATIAGQNRNSFIAGPVTIDPGKGIWNHLEATEFLSLGAVTAASFLRSRPVLCSGANLSYPREFFNEMETGVNGSDSPSGDDIFLLEKAKQSELQTAFIYRDRSIVKTRPTGSPSRFMNQRVRWASKSRFYGDKDMIRLALLVLSLNTFILAYAVLAATGMAHWGWVTAGWLIKSAVDFFLLLRWTSFTGQRSLMRYFPLVAIIYYIYVPLSGILGVLGGFSWKGRKY